MPPDPDAAQTGVSLVEAPEVCAAIRAHRYVWQNEDQLQEGLAGALTASGWTVEREVRLSEVSRIDLLIGRVGIEVKIAGTVEAVARQLQRYAASDLFDALVLVTSRARHRAVPAVLGGKPVTVIMVGGGFA